MSALASTSFEGTPLSIDRFWSAAACWDCLWQAASARPAAAMAMIILAFRIGETRCRVGFGARQLLLVEPYCLVFSPALSFTRKVEIAANRVRVGLDVRSGHGAGFIKAKLAGVDD